MESRHVAKVRADSGDAVTVEDVTGDVECGEFGPEAAGLVDDSGTAGGEVFLTGFGELLGGVLLALLCELDGRWSECGEGG